MNLTVDKRIWERFWHIKLHKCQKLKKEKFKRNVKYGSFKDGRPVLCVKEAWKGSSVSVFMCLPSSSSEVFAGAVLWWYTVPFQNMVHLPNTNGTDSSQPPETLPGMESVDWGVRSDEKTLGGSSLFPLPPEAPRMWGDVKFHGLAKVLWLRDWLSPTGSTQGKVG